MRRALLALQLLSVGLAAGLLFAPLPPSSVERYYADWMYPALQARLTSWSNETGVALFDFILLFLILALVVQLGRAITGALRQRSVMRLLRGLLATAATLALVYIWFEGVWGLNYDRVPIESAIGFDRARVTDEALRALARRAVEETNRAYVPGHAAGFPAVGAVPPALVTSFHAVERRLGRPRPTIPGRPKRTLLAAFFRASATDGMHAPFMLETLLNPDLTPPERPSILAHEWAHLSGYAPEDDASFVGFVAALGADPGSRYSAWLGLTYDAIGLLPRNERQPLLELLDAGPRADRQAISVRLQSRVETVQRVAWETYDEYLKAQGVREGIVNYSRVVLLIVGSGAVDW